MLSASLCESLDGVYQQDKQKDKFNAEELLRALQRLKKRYSSGYVDLLGRMVAIREEDRPSWGQLRDELTDSKPPVSSASEVS